MSHARMKTVFLQFSNYLPLSIFLIAAAVGKPGFLSLSADFLFLIETVLQIIIFPISIILVKFEASK